MAIAHEETIKLYLEDFARANPQAAAPRLSYENGWYVFRQRAGYVSSRHRHVEIEEIRIRLQCRSEESHDIEI